MNNTKSLLPFIDLLFILIIMLVIIISESDLNPKKMRFILENFYFFNSYSLIKTDENSKEETKPVTERLYTTKEEVERDVNFVLKTVLKNEKLLKESEPEKYRDIYINLQNLKMKDIKKVCKQIKTYYNSSDIDKIYIIGEFTLKNNSGINIKSTAKLASKSLVKIKNYCKIKNNIYLKIKLKFD